MHERHQVKLPRSGKILHTANNQTHEPQLLNLCSGAAVLQQEKPQWEDLTPQGKNRPLLARTRENPMQQQDPVQSKINKS